MQLGAAATMTVDPHHDLAEARIANEEGKRVGRVGWNRHRPAQQALDRAGVRDDEWLATGLPDCFGSLARALPERADRLAIPSRIFGVPDVVVRRLFNHLREREGAQRAAAKLHQPWLGGDLQSERLGTGLCGLLGTDRGACHDAIWTIAACCESRTELARLFLSDLGERVLGRPAMVGTARRVAVAGKQ